MTTAQTPSSDKALRPSRDAGARNAAADGAPAAEASKATPLYHCVKAASSARLSPAATIIGDVEIGEDACVLAGSHIRADYHVPVTIGREANIQEGVLIHVDEGFPVVVGNHATVGHGAILHGCTIEDNALVGMGATVLNGARIERDAVVGAGSLVTQGTVIPAGHLAFGSPARVVRALSADEIEHMCTMGADFYVETSAHMVEEGVLVHPDPLTSIWP